MDQPSPPPSPRRSVSSPEPAVKSVLGQSPPKSSLEPSDSCERHSNPLKRKDPADTPDDPCSPSPAVADPDITLTKGEYENGRIICDDCGEGVSIRDDSGSFTSHHWKEHRKTHAPSPSSATTQTAVHPAEIVSSSSQPPPAKRRRAKRTEEERIEYLRSDAYVAKYEAYRVLCKSCDKWIRLRPNSTYCSIPWDAHRKSCLAKRINSKNVYALEERNTLFAKDPDVRKFDAERVLCNMCDDWVSVSPDDHLQAVQTWIRHRDECHKTAGTTCQAPSGPPHPIAGPSNHHPPAPAAAPASHPSPADAPSPTSPKHPAQSHPYPRPPPSPSSPSHHTPLSAPFHDLNPANYAPAHESRRRNAEQRAATLRADKLIGQVEPNRVFCSLCQKWVQLRQDSSYCAYPWLQHRGKCLARHQRRAQKAAEIAAMKAKKFPGAPGMSSISQHGPQSSQEGRHHPLSDNDDLESEEDDDSEAEDEQRPLTSQSHASMSGAHHHHRHRHPKTEHSAPPPQQQQQYRILHSPQSSSHLIKGPYSHPSQSHPAGAHPYHRERSLSTSHQHRKANGYAPPPPPPPPPPRPSSSSGGGGGGGGASVYHHRVPHAPPRSPAAPEANADGDADVDMDADGESYVEDDRLAVPVSIPASSSSSGVGGGGGARRSDRASAVGGAVAIGGAGRDKRGGLADLDSASGRRAFIALSISHLFSTTYEPTTDDMSISMLLSYLNSAMPVDKHEDFDTSEVIRAVAALQDRGRVRFEGDMVRPVLE